jgi:hypothetical protein
MNQTLAVLLAATVLACGATTTPDGRSPCTAQTTCSLETTKVCEAGFCSPPLPANTAETLRLDVSTIVFSEPHSFRVAVVYPITPDGKTVKCDGIPSMQALKDPAKFNLTATVSQSQMPQGDAITYGVFINGLGRVVYVEAYSETPSELNGTTTPTVVGVGCLEDAPFAPDADPPAFVAIKLHH